MTDPTEPASYDLVMPFVVVASKGGHHHDAAFTAGWTCGAIDAHLTSLQELGGMIERWVGPDLLPQLDLIAMKHGQTMRTLDTSDDGDWVRIRIGHPALVDEPERP